MTYGRHAVDELQHSSRRRRRRSAGSAIAEVIVRENPDIVGLNEVDCHTRRSGGIDEAEELARLTGMRANPGKRDDLHSTERRKNEKTHFDIEIRVTNLWPNRLIGDDVQFEPDCEWVEVPHRKKVVEYGIKELPQWVKEGKPSPTGRHTFSTWRH